MDKQKFLEQFKQIYFEENGEMLSDQDAFERFNILIQVTKVITKNIERKQWKSKNTNETSCLSD